MAQLWIKIAATIRSRVAVTQHRNDWVGWRVQISFCAYFFGDLLLK
jgi:hypothetical protein